MGKLILFFGVFLITSCTTLQQTEELSAKSWLANDNTLHYEGDLTREAMNNLFSLYSKAEIKPTLLQITSPGGSVDLGIEFGHWVHDKKLNIAVENLCGSSCANYIFPAGQKKILKKDSILIWHGGSLQDNVSQNILKGDDFAIKWRMKEWRFYNRINVNPMLNVYGSVRKHSIKWYQYPLGWLGLWELDYFGFDYSLDDMKKFGITNIQLVDGTWDWRKHHIKKETLNAKVYRVKVTQETLSDPFSYK